jgi:Bacterial tandem repeat domain 1
MHMSYITTGLTNGGVTTHFKFSYDSALAAPAGPEPTRTNAVIAAVESDYNMMSGWFGGGIAVTGMTVQVTTESNGASWSGSATSSTIQLKAQGASYSNNSAYLRYLIVSEVTEIFMMAQNKGWFQSGNEGSKGEGLSRFLGGQFLVNNGFLGVGIDKDYAVADLWLNSTRQDFVNNAPDDNGDDATNGCTTLLIYYLFHQLGFTIDQIVAAASTTLAAVYKNLTGDPNDPFPLFSQLLATQFPSQTSSAVAGPNFDDPWPLGAMAYSGVWRGGTGAYYLWINADQTSFLAKWSALGAQNLRLVDVDVTTVNGQQLWSGIWDGGTDGYYLWINADQASFLAKWSALAAQNLRLVSIRTYNGLYAGVWREGTGAYYLWINADQASFLAKWSELAAQNLRLVAFDVATVNGQQLWSGVWLPGSDGYYLWINANWSNFVAKWTELAAQNLRLVGIRNYNGLWAGIWRQGTDGYYLWVNANESSFLAKWAGLAAQNLRLINLVTMPAGSSGGSTTAAAFAPSGAAISTGIGGGRLEASAPPVRLDVGGTNLGHAAVTAASASAAAGEGGGSNWLPPANARPTILGDGGGSLVPSTATPSAVPVAPVRSPQTAGPQTTAGVGGGALPSEVGVSTRSGSSTRKGRGTRK